MTAYSPRFTEQISGQRSNGLVSTIARLALVIGVLYLLQHNRRRAEKAAETIRAEYSLLQASLNRIRHLETDNLQLNQYMRSCVEQVKDYVIFAMDENCCATTWNSGVLGWDWNQNELMRDEHGCWFAEVPNATFGQQYRFAICKGEERFTRVDPYARSVSNSVGNGILVDLQFDWGNDGYELPPRNEMVIYEMHIGTFNVKEPGRLSTLDEAIEKLDHLVQLGINVVEIMPCAEFAGDLSWGYNPAHVFAIEEAYGGPLALKRFVQACHARGIGVLRDVVYNHFGPSDLCLWQFDGWSENGKGGVYFYND
jgi:1,4-alpha-glucan branching enzyme